MYHLLKPIAVCCAACTTIVIASCASTPTNNKDVPKADSAIKVPLTGDTSKLEQSTPGEYILANETIGDMKIGDSKKFAPAQWDSTTRSLWEADGRVHQQFVHRDSKEVVDVSSSDSSFVDAVITSITITAPSTIKTRMNIGIGSSVEQVRRAYSGFINAEESNDSTLVAGSVYGGLIFSFRNKKVNRVFLGAAAE